MTIDDVKARVASIAAQITDDEMAHSAEDDLHVAVLRAIANGAADAPALAREALKTTVLEFRRWYA